MSRVKPANQYDQAVFIKFGEFTASMLLWWTPRAGYFVTGRDGSSLNGEPRVSRAQLDPVINASK